MGYETKAYFVEPNKNTSPSTFVKDGDHWRRLWSEEHAGHKYYYHYGVDGNTKTYVQPESSETCVRKYCSVVAMVDMCNSGSWPEASITEHYFYADDGNTPVVQDRHGDFLSECSLEDFIVRVEKENTANYRRYDTALAVAKSMIGKYNDVKVLLYGH